MAMPKLADGLVRRIISSFVQTEGYFQCDSVGRRKKEDEAADPVAEPQPRTDWYPASTAARIWSRALSAARPLQRSRPFR